MQSVKTHILSIFFKLILALSVGSLLHNSSFAESYNGFKNFDDYIYWERADTIKGKVYTQADRVAFVDSMKQIYRSSEFYKIQWAKSDTVAGKVYTAEEKDQLISKQFRERLSKQNDDYFKQMEEKHRKPDFDLGLFLAVLFGFGILALIMYAKKAYDKEVADSKLTPEQRAQKKMLDSMTLVEKIELYQATDKGFQARLAKTITDSITNTDRKDLPVRIQDNDIYIRTTRQETTQTLTIVPVFKITETPFPISIYQDDALHVKFQLDFNLMEQYDQSLKYFHAEVRIHPNDTVQIEGVLSDNANTYPEGNPSFRFQPFYLGKKNKMAEGNNSFEIGLNFSGYITPPNVRFICICSACESSFSLDKWHCGFSETNFAYSSNCKEITSVRAGDIENGPFFWTGIETPEHIKNYDSQLAESSDGSFGYLNPLRCPHCAVPFFDYANYLESRRQEYYGLYYPGQPFKGKTNS